MCNRCDASAGLIIIEKAVCDAKSRWEYSCAMKGELHVDTLLYHDEYKKLERAYKFICEKVGM